MDVGAGGGAALLLGRRFGSDKSSEIRTTVFNRISAAALIKFYDFLMRAYSRAVLIKTSLNK